MGLQKRSGHGKRGIGNANAEGLIRQRQRCAAIAESQGLMQTNQLPEPIISMESRKRRKAKADTTLDMGIVVYVGEMEKGCVFLRTPFLSYHIEMLVYCMVCETPFSTFSKLS
jgi:hypothetical protein